jgi:hypothetical protein
MFLNKTPIMYAGIKGLQCDFCLKKYTRKTSLDRHSVVCEILQKTQRERRCEEEESSDIPTMKQLYMIVQELAKKNTVLERKIEELNKWVDRKKNKINLIEWLNDNIIPKVNLREWFDPIEISDDDIMILMNDNVAAIFIHLLKKNAEKGQNPIICFNHKTSNLYVYKNSDEKWQKLSINELSYWLREIHHKILITFEKWYNKNIDKINKSDSQQIAYNKALMAIMKADLNETCSVLQRIKRELFNLLKIDIKGIVEYEI